MYNLGMRNYAIDAKEDKIIPIITTESQQEQQDEDSKGTSFVKKRNEKVEEKYPLSDNIKRNKLLKIGRLSILLYPLDHKEGILSLAKNIEADSDDLLEQYKTALFTGAAAEIASCILGYPDNTDFDETDSQLYSERFEEEIDYLLFLSEKIKGIKGGLRMNYGPSAAFDLVSIIEHATSIPRKDRHIYLAKSARRRIDNIFGKAVDVVLFKELLEKDVKYLESAIDTNRKSHGRKDVSYIESQS
jgi:hypothetical protein